MIKNIHYQECSRSAYLFLDHFHNRKERL
uniref:Uncharacterized protein n=1 Tax=Anguilla anguilla TaxID=7936 RepID=A0A0E9S8Q2_ANGAN